MRHSLDDRGITLIELAIVLAIVGIVTAIAIPNYLAMLPRIRVNMAVADVSNLLNKAKLRSISQNIPYIVTFDTVNNRCGLYRDVNGDLAAQAGELMETTDIKSKYPGIVFGHNVTKDTSGAALGSTVKLKFTNPNVTGVDYTLEIFRPNGTAKHTGVVYLIPQVDVPTAGNTDVRYDRNRAVTVESTTGFVKTWSHDNNKDGKWY